MLALYAAFARMRLPKAGDLPALALMGFPVFGAFTVFLGCGRLTVPASTASLLIATIPAFMALWVMVAFIKGSGSRRSAGRGWSLALWGSQRSAEKPAPRKSGRP